ncbi:hypothetical protein BU23DRAFT_583196 [Bimuria novae-zelandiae CBS 107.79]|uniref:Tachykinin family protein n=1 Tax=Bimuria novae-zelandiae CBS 107.79 TaxID=1447943 RepID=A0A6A5UVR0_9PLEO|nr:hypothetical protein BU23DRAFT_583196 [Bimuria novae-zelandiae CBS 107.79]
MASKTAVRHLLLEPRQIEVFEETSAMEREYEFFVTTEEPNQPDGQDRGRIRRVVMRNFFETKSVEGGNRTSEHNSKETVQKKTSLKSRFRLSKPGQEAEAASRTKPKATWKQQQEDRKKGGRPTVSRQSSDDSQKRNGGTLSQRTSPSDSAKFTKGNKKTKLILRINPVAHRFDPFDVLPVPGTPQLDILVKLYRSGCRVNSIAINARNSWWSFIRNDAGLLHATLATWALYGMLIQDGTCDFRVEKLRHKSEAIKLVNTEIRDHEGQISDELVGTVSTLASFENLHGAYDAAQLHIAALKRMVNARGGLFAFGHNDGLLRGMLWVDIHTATAFRTPPSFPIIRLDPATPPLPHELLEEAAYTSPTSILHLSSAAIECFNIFYRLHRLALAVSSRWIRQVSRLTFSNLLYETEYMLLSVPDCSSDFLDFDLESQDKREEGYSERAALADAASVVEALLAAAQIFIYAALREVPPGARLFSILLERLRVALDRPDVSMVGVWTKANNAHMLLWALVVASSVASAEGDRSWWVGKLYEVMKELNVRSLEQLQKALERVAWTDVFFADVLGGVWQQVKEYGKALQVQEACLMINTESALEHDVLDGEGATFNSWQERVEGNLMFHQGRWMVNGWYV